MARIRLKLEFLLTKMLWSPLGSKDGDHSIFMLPIRPNLQEVAWNCQATGSQLIWDN
jgi:hypothetical protein